MIEEIIKKSTNIKFHQATTALLACLVASLCGKTRASWAVHAHTEKKKKTDRQDHALACGIRYAPPSYRHVCHHAVQHVRTTCLLSCTQNHGWLYNTTQYEEHPKHNLTTNRSSSISLSRRRSWTELPHGRLLLFRHCFFLISTTMMSLSHAIHKQQHTKVGTVCIHSSSRRRASNGVCVPRSLSGTTTTDCFF